MSIQSCPLCEVSSFNALRFGLLQCRDCGMVVSPAVWEPQINEVMEDEWFSEDYATSEASVWKRWFEAHNNRLTFSRIRNAGVTSGHMLEIGTGSGSLLGFMKQRGWQVQGCDLSEAVCAMAALRYAVPVHCGDVATLSKELMYDLVVMNHVLEHVQHPVEMLREVKQRMRSNGFLHLTVPNVACWEARLSGWNSYEPYHLLYFTPASVLLAVERAGFHVERMVTHDSFSGWLLALLRSLLGQRQKSEVQRRAERIKRTTSPIEHAYCLAMVVSGAITWPMRRMQEKLGKGDELIVLARA